jgi:hypothetical protein
MYHSESRIATLPPDGRSEVHELCSEYRSLGWWVEGKAETDQITLIVGGRASALAMPAELAERVHRVLSIHMLAGPVLTFPAKGLWVFLAEPDAQADCLPADVVAKNVTAARTGTRLRLPASRRGFGEVRWIARPEAGRPLPPWQAVVSATRRALSEELLRHSA